MMHKVGAFVEPLEARGEHEQGAEEFVSTERRPYGSAARSAPAVRSEPASGGQGANEE